MVDNCDYGLVFGPPFPLPWLYKRSTDSLCLPGLFCSPSWFTTSRTCSPGTSALYPSLHVLPAGLPHCCSIVSSAYSPTSPAPSDPSSSHLPGRSWRQKSHSSFLNTGGFDEDVPAAPTPNHSHHLTPNLPHHSLPVHLNIRPEHAHRPKRHAPERSLTKLKTSLFISSKLLCHCSHTLYTSYASTNLSVPIVLAVWNDNWS